jgi:hypothetical protein
MEAQVLLLQAKGCDNLIVSTMHCIIGGATTQQIVNRSERINATVGMIQKDLLL